MEILFSYVVPAKFIHKPKSYRSADACFVSWFSTIFVLNNIVDLGLFSVGLERCYRLQNMYCVLRSSISTGDYNQYCELSRCA